MANFSTRRETGRGTLLQSADSRFRPGLASGQNIQLAALIGAAVVVGGGGVAFGLNNLVVQLLALGLLAINYSAVADFVRNGPRALVVLVIASMAVPLMQCIPLPPGVWHSLPGRDLALQSMRLLGLDGNWLPVSVDWNRTLLAGLSLVSPFAVMVLANRIGSRSGAFIFRVIVAIGLCTIALGAVQLASDGKAGLLYHSPRNLLYGTFANRNSTALFLVISLTCHLALLPDGRDSLKRVLHFLAGILLAVGVVLTQSRSGTALMALVVAAYLAFWLFDRKGEASGRYRGGIRAAIMGLSLVAVIAAGAISLSNTRLDRTFSRFSEIEGIRTLIWQDALVSAERFWPVGSGVSTFDEVFQVDESLEYLDDRRTGRAHNDYLEVAIESGLAGVVLVMFWLAWIARHGWLAIGKGRSSVVRAAGISIVAILAQSVIDYPLRNQALLCVAAFMVSLLARPPRTSDIEGTSN